MTDLGKLLAEVTPGEWTWEGKRGGGAIRALTIAGTYNDIVCAEEYAGACWLEVGNDANARLIAMAPTLARKVIAAEKLAVALRHMTAQFQHPDQLADEALAAWGAAQ